MNTSRLICRHIKSIEVLARDGKIKRGRGFATKLLTTVEIIRLPNIKNGDYASIRK